MPRKQKKYHYIYKTTNLLNGKYYIGMHSTHNLNDEYMGSGKRLRYSINKYGKKNHIKEILEYLDSREELKKKEKEIVNLNEIAKKDCMNLQIGGGGGFSKGFGFQKGNKYGYLGGKKGANGLIKRLKNDLAYLQKHKDFFIKNIQKDWTGKKHKQETKDKIGKTNSIKQKGSKNSQYGTCWITNEKENKKIFKGDLLIPKGWRLGRKINNGSKTGERSAL